MLMRGLLVAGVLTALSTLSLAQNKFSDRCPNGNPLPFSSIEVKQSIDDKCGLDGSPGAPAASHTQNEVKNNFCGTNAPEPFTLQMLVDLQKQTHIPMGQGKEPTDRSALTALGEGKVIRLKANLIEAHYADLGGGETVNCNGATEQDNDIHIAFGPETSTQECASVSAEISPHFRPASWAQIGNFEKFDFTIKKNVVNQQIASRLQAHPYRVTGQLFLDASHATCPCGTHCSPSRATGWEMHPVYNIEVCKAGTSCNVDSDSDWIAFDKWWSGLQPAHLPKPHTHSPHEPGTKKKGGTSAKKKTG